MLPNGWEALVEGWSPKLAKAFLDAIYAIRNAAQIGLIAQFLEKGDVDGAIRAVGLDPVAFRDFDSSLAQAYENGGKYTAQNIPPIRSPDGFRLAIMFDVRNPRAEQWLRDRSSSLVTQIVADQRVAIRQHLVAGMETGTNPKTVALDLVGRISPVSGKREGGVIGLTSTQEQWARSYEAGIRAGDATVLDMKLGHKTFAKSIRRTIAKGEKPSEETIQKAVAAYRNRALKYRGDTIGRTEALTSLHTAQHEAMQQAIDKGQVQESAIRKVWHSAADNRVRDTHRVLNGESVAFRADFVSPSGAHLRYPGDPDAPPAETIMCRCWMQQRIDFLRNIH